MKSSKHLLSLALVVLLVTGLLPISILAQEAMASEAESAAREAIPEEMEQSEDLSSTETAVSIEEESDESSVTGEADGEPGEQKSLEGSEASSEDTTAELHDGSETQGGMIALAPAGQVGNPGIQIQGNFSHYYEEARYNIIAYKNNGEVAYVAGRYYTGNTVAYCLNIGEGAPNGNSYISPVEPGLAFYAVLLLGYPTFTNIGGYQLTEDQAREATQFAIWCMDWKLGNDHYLVPGGARTTSTPGAANTLAAGLWLYNQCSGLPNTSMTLVDPNDYFDMGTLHAPTEEAPVFWDAAADTLRSGPYYVSSVLAGANTKYIPAPVLNSTGLPSYAYYGDASGNRMTSPGFNTDFYLYLARASMPVKGSISLEARVKFNTPAALIWRPAQASYQNMLTPTDPRTGDTESLIPFSWDTAVVTKTDSETREPLAGAVLELYTYPVIVEDGSVTTDTAAIELDDPGWVRVGQPVTSDAEGGLDFGVLPYGFYKLVEITAPPGYQTPAQTGQQPLSFILDANYEGAGIVVGNYLLSNIETLKLDADTASPIPDTEFTLYSYPVTLEEGLITTPLSSIAANDPAWSQVAIRTTDAAGRLDFAGLPFGYYQIVETRPNSAYASYEESGGRACFVRLDTQTTNEVQVFEDEAIQLSCEIYKDTVNLTSAAFRTDESDLLAIDNTNHETYHYDLDFRSTANVRADEFTVIDPLENANLGQVRIEELFTPVAWGDTDGCFNLWFRTNLTDPTRVYSTASAMTTNPFNPNNPTNQQLWPSTGWQLWCEGLATTQTTHLFVADLGLAEGEYLTGLRFEYGSVEVGFTTRNTVRTGLQVEREDKPAYSDWTPRTTDAFYSSQAAAAIGLKPATYLVSCPDALLPPILITSSAEVYIARNLVLSDEDHDAVLTGVIRPFMFQTHSEPPTDLSQLSGSGTPHNGPLPVTGDDVLRGLFVAALCGLFAALVLFWRGLRARQAGEARQTEGTCQLAGSRQTEGTCQPEGNHQTGGERQARGNHQSRSNHQTGDNHQLGGERR
ncbi:MAG: Cys-Gln thioester bond-forming surface protein [Coriobacteriales bacterium]|jgi:TQXA domain-containing protein|nr:Cys-Gln thioester bond-forming surface protein [Coriobacteriales bacterium]